MSKQPTAPETPTAGPAGVRVPGADRAERAERAERGRRAGWPGRAGGTGTSDLPGRIVAALLVAGILTQISYPLTSGTVLRVVTVVSVVLLTSAGVLHAALRWSAAHAAVLFLVAGGIGLLAEAVGVRTGYPFGEYVYTGQLGLKLAEVPLLVPIAWTMIAYPALLLGRRLAARPDGSTSRIRTVLLGGITLASWDLYLDPQMIAQDAWRFAHPTPHLPGVPGIPLTNFAGWVLVALVMIAALDRALPDRPRHHPTWEWPAAAVLTWTWLGSAVGNLLFFGRPWVALYGGLVMGLTMLPYLRRLAAASQPGQERQQPSEKPTPDTAPGSPGATSARTGTSSTGTSSTGTSSTGTSSSGTSTSNSSTRTSPTRTSPTSTDNLTAGSARNGGDE
ncbi:carotenoid biosynthesis protein [Kineosporia rhizophila]|uniref:carotenoid biosynthesis protein n=1 Tax=Kineosporia rhizophila TaxID=84633 RepID=UPI001E32A43C|nr:carotenoid biosynthesis protein [Kineosporia rhizophila]